MSRSARSQRDQRWSERIRKGDHEAFEALFQAYADDLCGFALQYVDSSAAAEDVVQEVFCDLWKRRNDWEPRRSVKAYLFQAVRNTALDRLKHQRVVQEWETEKKYKGPSSRPQTPTQAVQHQELKDAMQEAVESLPERRRRVYKLVRRKGMSYAEVAEIMDIARKTVENHMGRALKALRKRLSKFKKKRD